MRLFLHRTIDVRQIVCKEVPSVPNKRGGWNKRVGGNFVEKCVLMGFFLHI